MTEYLRKKRRPEMPRAREEYLDPTFRTDIPLQPGTAPIEIPEPAKIETALLLWYTFDTTNQFSPTLNSTSSFKKGYNWQVWKDAVSDKITARGGNQAEIVESNPGQNTGTIRFTGEAVWDFASCFDRVFCGHAPPVPHLQAIRARTTGTVPVIGFHMFNFESYNQGAEFNPSLEQFRAIAKLAAFRDTGGAFPDEEPDPTFGCQSNGRNGYGKKGIDKFEQLDRTGVPCSGTWTPSGVIGSPGPGGGVDATADTKHSWDCRTDKPGYPSVMAGLFPSWISGNYPGGELSAIMWDVVDDGPFAGNNGTDPEAESGATNRYPSSFTPTAYRSGWVALFAALASQIPATEVWGNCPDNLVYTGAQVPRRLIEHWFREWTGTAFRLRTLGELQASIDLMIDNGIRLLVGGVSGPGNVDPWFTGPGPGGASGTWADILAKVATKPPGMFYALAGEAISGGYLMWQPEMSPPH